MIVPRECPMKLTSVLLAVIVLTSPGVCQESDITKHVLRRQGDDSVHTYRIPGLTTTRTGTLIAVFDIRHGSSGDLPANIDVGMMRSTDDGATWSSMKSILDFDQTVADSRGNGVGDPAVLADLETGRIFVVALWSQGNRAWHGSGPGLLPEETGQLVMTTSDDDGLTWSAPVNLTSHIRNRNVAWRLFFNGPGRGIQLSNGNLVFAAQFRDEAGVPHSCLLISSDHGETWSVTAPAIPAQPPTSESQVAPLPDGRLLLTMRDESRSGKRAWSVFSPGTEPGAGTWSDHWSVVSDPTCMASLIAHPDGRLLFSHPDSSKQRVAMTVHTSRDGGRTWTDGRLIDKRPSAYSCMTVLRDGSVGLLYETGDKNAAETLTFARIRL